MTYVIEQVSFARQKTSKRNLHIIKERDFIIDVVPPYILGEKWLYHNRLHSDILLFIIMLLFTLIGYDSSTNYFKWHKLIKTLFGLYYCFDIFLNYFPNNLNYFANYVTTRVFILNGVLYIDIWSATSLFMVIEKT